MMFKPRMPKQKIYKHSNTHMSKTDLLQLIENVFTLTSALTLTLKPQAQ